MHGLHPTFLARPSLAADPNAGYMEATKIYNRLSSGSWRCNELHPWEDPLLLEICDIVSPNSVVKDTGIAGALRRGLVSRGFLTARPLDDPHWTEFVKAATPPEPDTRTWDEIENDHLRTLQEQERRLLDQEYENQQRFTQQLAEFHGAPERAQLLRQLQELGVVGRDEIVSIVREVVAAEVAAALSRHMAATNDDRLDGAQNGAS